MTKAEILVWTKILYRGLRPAIASGLAQAFLLNPDWLNWSSSWRNILVVFLSGFLPSFGMWLRDRLDEWFGWDGKSIAQKVMPI